MMATASVATGLGIGALATLLMDGWFVARAAVARAGRFSVAPMGRWFGYLFRGRLVHAEIGTTPPLAGEVPLGWAFHYGVGAIYGAAFIWLVGPTWLAHPRLLPAWLFAIATVAAGWFILQPGLGMGFAASRTARPNTVRALDLAAHTVFGIGLWVGALVLR